ncbi:unnamed protein product [Callosobruchus maculatus]|uniref:C2H2-type domain-containing protein n=1 Tax=Callosobruchus maculatus TaxID=64391 RepID=A0A653C0X1_CALMS|nr:unnamed protein product [Callosobruchus maculatus]
MKILKMGPEIEIEDDVDYNYCRYCAEEFESAKFRNKHEVQCHMGPQLQVQLSTAEFQNACLLSGIYKTVNSGGQASSMSIKHKRSKWRDNSKLKYRSRGQSNGHIEQICNPKTNHQIKSRKAKQASAAHSKYYCSVCDYISKRQDLLEKHMLTHGVVSGKYENFDYKCEHCCYMTHHENYLSIHCAHKHNEYKIYNCSVCQHKSKHKVAFQKHMLTHGVVTDRFAKMLKCDQCDYKTRLKHCLNAHILIHTSQANMNYKCQSCNYKTFTNKALRRHMLIHNKDKHENYFKCYQCDYKSNRKDTLKRHIIIHSKAKEENMLKCGQCDYKTYRNDYLKNHSFMHSADKNSKKQRCRQCDFKTDRKGGLIRHILARHTPRIRRKCEQCNFTTLSKDSLSQHKLTHAIEGVNKIYKCEQCGLKTFRKQQFRKHMLMHDAKEDPSKWNYNCNICNYKTFRQDSLKKHLKIHEERIRLYCQMCGYSAYHKESLKRHIVSHSITTA